MFGERAFQDWKSRRGAVEERERARVRSEIETEVDAALVDIRDRASAEKSRQRFLHANRHARAVTAPRDPDPQNPIGTERRTADGAIWVRKS